MMMISDVLTHSWQMLLEAAPYVWIGLISAGVLHAWVPQDWIMSQLGGRGQGSVWKAALLGIPLPLCSCGVIPAAVGIRKQGAGRGATLSFLISTPETSADSIALTWAMLGPVWAIIRPVAAMATAVITGTIANLFPDDHRAADEVSDCDCCHDTNTASRSQLDRLRGALKFVTSQLIPDIGGWLLLGILLSGVVLTILPTDFLSSFPGGAWAQMILMLLVGIPLYICASASTPLAAALLIKGLAPGAALVLLLAGPATNIASALVISRQLGKVGTTVYLGGVALGSLAAGALVQMFAPQWQLGEIVLHTEMLPVWLSTLFAITLVAAILVIYVRGRSAHRHTPHRSREVEDHSKSKVRQELHRP